MCVTSRAISVRVIRALPLACIRDLPQCSRVYVWSILAVCVCEVCVTSSVPGERLRYGARQVQIRGPVRGSDTGPERPRYGLWRGTYTAV